MSRPRFRILTWGYQFSSVQLLSRVWLFVTPWTAARQASLSSTMSQSLVRYTSNESVMLSNHLILCHPFSFCPQSFPASGSFPVSNLFASGCQSIGASASAPVLPMSNQGWFPLGLTGLISLLSKGFSKVFSCNTIKKHQFFDAQPILWSSPHIYTGKTIALTIWTFVGKVMSQLLNTLSRFVTAILPRSKCLLISWLQSLLAVILEPKNIKSVTVSIFSLFAMK